MIIYIGFDDTDAIDSDFGTGKVCRGFEKHLPDGAVCTGAVRQQLLVCDEIPYTSHNSSACMMVEVDSDKAGNGFIQELTDLAADYLIGRAAEGSDPGLCIMSEFDPSIDEVMDYGYTCTHSVSSQKDALGAVNGGVILGLGGSNDGLIGAAAAVGLTAAGWAGRYIEFGALRQFPQRMTVSEIMSRNIQVISTDRDAQAPAPHDPVITNGWVRPFRLGGRPVLFVTPAEKGVWENIHFKRRKKAR